jgi:general stress protein YciG
MRKRQPLTAVEMGRKGGTARAKNLTPEQLSAIGRKGAQSRWAKKPRGREGV